MDAKIGHLINEDMLKVLKEVFPFNRPRPTDTDRSIWIKSGNQEVIEFLQQQFDDRFAQAQSTEDSADVSGT